MFCVERQTTTKTGGAELAIDTFVRLFSCVGPCVDYELQMGAPSTYHDLSYPRHVHGQIVPSRENIHAVAADGTAIFFAGLIWRSWSWQDGRLVVGSISNERSIGEEAAEETKTVTGSSCGYFPAYGDRRF